MQNGFRFSLRNNDKEQLYLTKKNSNWAQGRHAVANSLEIYFLGLGICGLRF
jgi:hypothetical protein